MVREPVAGAVKTRLGRGIGMTGAAWWYRHQIRDLLRRLRDRRWHLELSVTPDNAVSSAVWPRDLRRRPQGAGDLGDRMARAMRRSSAPVVLIGSDIPDIAPAHIFRAFGALRKAPAVIGPSDDGGFWLIGLRVPRDARPRMFREVEWSQMDTLKQTLARMPKNTEIIDILRDVDTAEDLGRFRGKSA